MVNLRNQSSQNLRFLAATALLALAFVWTDFAHAGSGITYQGRIRKPDGSPLEGSTVTFKLQIRTPGSQNCLMYEEQQTLDMRNTSGLFNLTMNSTDSVRTDSTGFTLDRIFGNRGTFNFASGCAIGSTYSPNAEDGRMLVVSFKDETMASFEQIPPTTLNFVPMAIEAQQVTGFKIGSLLRVQEADGTMGNVSPLSNASYTELLALIAGTSTQYVRNGTSAGARVPTYIGNPASPVAGSIWFDTSSNQLKFRDSSGVQSVGTSGGSVTSVTAGAGLATTPAGGITSTGSIAIAAGGVVSTMLADGSVVTTKIADGGVTDVKLANGAVVTAKIADGAVTEVKIADGAIATAKIADSAVTSVKIADGTIAGADLASNITISTTGSVTAGGFTTSGTVTANAVTAPTVSAGVNITRQIQLFDPDAGSTNKITFSADSALASDYTLTWPLDDGASNQVLTTDGSGKLSWTTFTPGTGDFKADGSVPMTGNLRLGGQWLSNDGGSEGIRVDNSGKVGVGTATPQELLDINGAIRVGTTTTCGAPNPGTIRYNSGNLEYCNGTAWQILGVAGAGITALTGDVTASGTGSVAATISNDAITNAKMADNAIGNAELADNAVNTAEIADSAVTSAKIADGTIATADVANKAVTFAKVQDIATNKLVGRSTASSGPMEEIAIGSGLSLSGGTLSNTVTDSFGALSCANGELLLRVAGAWSCVGATSAGTADTVVRRDSSGNFVAGTATLTSSLVLKDGAAGGGVTIATPVGFTNYSLTLPSDDGNNGQVLTTNGSGLLSWSTPATGTGDFKADGSVAMTGNLKLNNSWLSNDGGAEGIRVDNTGKVGIGTASPTAALHVVGQDTTSGSAAPGLIVQAGNANGLISGAGGSISLLSGNGWTAGGDILIQTGYGNGGAHPGGTLTLDSRGPLVLKSGQDGDGLGREITITGGTSAGSNGLPGGEINIVGGRASTLATGGDVKLTGGSAQSGANGNGGDIVLNGGAKVLGGTDGDVILANLQGKVGVGTTSPKELLDVAGAIRVGTTTTCGAPNPGTIRYNAGNLEYCNGTAWQVLGVAGAGITALTGDVTASGTGSVAATIANNAITSAKIVDGTIATADVADSTITSLKIADGTIATADIADSAVTSLKIADGTIATADVADKAVTFAKVQDIATNKLVGRSTASSGPMEEITVGTGLSLSGGTLSSSVTGLPSCSDGQLAIYVTSAWTCVGVGSTNVASTVVRRDGSGNFVAGSATLTSSLVLKDGAAGGGVTIATPTGFTSYALTLPVDDGNANQVLTTNGSGVLSWSTPSSGTGDFKADGTVSMTGNIKLNNNWLSNDGGNEGIRIDNVGKVGIGNSAPDTLLHVGPGQGFISSPSKPGGSSTIYSNIIGATAGSSVSQVIGVSDGTRNSRAEFFFADNATQGSGAWGLWQRHSTGGAQPFVLGVDDLEKMRIDITGKVGIGTSSPKELLDVAGAIRIGTTTTCGAPNPGTIRYNAGNLEYCNGTAWQVLGVAGAGITALTGDVTASGTGSVAATIANDAITNAKMADNAIGNAELADNAVNTAEIADSAVTTAKIADGTIATADVANKAVTFAKIQDIATNKLIGRSTAATGSVEEISIGTGLSLSGGTLSSTATDSFAAISCANGELILKVAGAWACVGATSANTASTVVRRDSSGNFVSGSATLTSSLILKDGAAGGQVTIATPVGFTNYALTLPVDDGNNGQVLTTNGSGALSWTTTAGGMPSNSIPIYQVRAATTANITLSGAQTIDGVAVVAGDRVLVKNQTTAAQNGVYVVAAGAWTRATDMDAWSETIGYEARVSEGTAWAGMTYTSSTLIGGTLGTTAIQWNAAGSGNSGRLNTANGYQALSVNTTGQRNTVNGYQALGANTTGGYNTANGAAALLFNTTGNNNTAIGYGALWNNNAKSESTAVGYNSMQYAHSTSTGSVTYNTALGAFSLEGSTTPSNNTGLRNTALGHSALMGMTSGSDNIGLGYNAGSAITTGSGNVVIGSHTGSTIATSSNNILIADGAGTERVRIDSNGKFGIGTTSPQEMLDVAGAIRVGTTTTCGAPNPGTIRYNSGSLEYCNGTAWQVVSTGASGITALTGDVTASGGGSVATTIAASAVTSAKIADGTIATADVADSAVTSLKIADGTIATADVADKAITFAKVQDMATNKLLGRSTAASGPMEELSIGTGLSLSGGTLSSTLTGLPACADGQLALYVTSAWTCVGAGSTNTASTVVRRDSSGNFVAGSATLTSSLVLKDGAAGGGVTIATPVGFTSYALTLPVDDGLSNQVLTTNGSGVLSWTSPALVTPGDNVGIGNGTLSSLTTGTRNTVVGYQSGNSITSHTSITAIGYQSAYTLAAGATNIIAIGDRAGYNGAGMKSNNIAIGASALQNADGSENNAIGYQAMYNNDGTNNIAMGSLALVGGTGTGNIGIGPTSGWYVNGTESVFIGRNVFNNSTGNVTPTTGDKNTVVGAYAASKDQARSGSFNVIMGTTAGRDLSSGSNNTLIGFDAGKLLATGNNNILLGANLQTPTTSTSNYLSIGNAIYGDLSTAYIGIGIAVPTQKLHVNGSVLADAYLYTSDRRLKKDFRPLDESLEKLVGLSTVKYRWITPANPEADREQIGLIAQEVQQVYPQAVHQDDKGWLRLDYSALIAPIIDSVRELYHRLTGVEAKTQQLEKQVADLQQKNLELEQRLQRLEQSLSGGSSRNPASK